MVYANFPLPSTDIVTFELSGLLTSLMLSFLSSWLGTKHEMSNGWFKISRGDLPPWNQVKKTDYLLMGIILLQY